MVLSASLNAEKPIPFLKDWPFYKKIILNKKKRRRSSKIGRSKTRPFYGPSSLPVNPMCATRVLLKTRLLKHNLIEIHFFFLSKSNRNTFPSGHPPFSSSTTPHLRIKKKKKKTPHLLPKTLLVQQTTNATSTSRHLLSLSLSLSTHV